MSIMDKEDYVRQAKLCLPTDIEDIEDKITTIMLYQHKLAIQYGILIKDIQMNLSYVPDYISEHMRKNFDMLLEDDEENNNSLGYIVNDKIKNPDIFPIGNDFVSKYIDKLVDDFLEE